MEWNVMRMRSSPPGRAAIVRQDVQNKRIERKKVHNTVTCVEQKPFQVAGSLLLRVPPGKGTPGLVFSGRKARESRARFELDPPPVR